MSVDHLYNKTSMCVLVAKCEFYVINFITKKPPIWNSLPGSIIQASSVEELTRLIANYYKYNNIIYVAV